MIDAAGGILGQEALDHLLQVTDTRKRTSVLEGTQWPGNSFAHHTIQQVQITLVARTVNHTRTHDVHLLSIRDRILIRKVMERTLQCLRCKLLYDIVLCRNLRFSVRAYRRRDAILCQELPFHPVCRTLHRRELYELLCRRMRQIPVEYLLRQTCIYLEIHICRTLVLRVMRFTC